ncbi:putative transposase OrfB [Paracoccaceae bacterium]
MIDKNHPSLSAGAQCRLLSISRSSFYYELMGETAMNLDLMVKIDKQFLETPFYGVQQMTWHLRNDGHVVNSKRIRRLMRLMRLMPIYQKPDTSRPAKGHKTYPYLLGGLRVERPNQVWCADITYIPMRRGFLYLVAIMDWYTRKVLAWRISNTLEADFYLAFFRCKVTTNQISLEARVTIWARGPSWLLLGIVALAALTNRLTAKTWVISRRCLRKSYLVHQRLIGLRFWT